MVLPYVSLVQSVDSLHLLQAIESWGAANGRTVHVLLEQHIASEETKQGFSGPEILDILRDAASYPHVSFRGLMGMASLTEDPSQIEEEFSWIAGLKAAVNENLPELKDFTELSIGMSHDWRIALGFGATIVRIGTAIFGPREY